MSENIKANVNSTKRNVYVFPYNLHEVFVYLFLNIKNYRSRTFEIELFRQRHHCELPAEVNQCGTAHIVSFKTTSAK